MFDRRVCGESQALVAVITHRHCHWHYHCIELPILQRLMISWLEFLKPASFLGSIASYMAAWCVFCLVLCDKIIPKEFTNRVAACIQLCSLGWLPKGKHTDRLYRHVKAQCVSSDMRECCSCGRERGDGCERGFASPAHVCTDSVLPVRGLHWAALSLSEVKCRGIGGAWISHKLTYIQFINPW